jgi:hypothetical protein
MISTPYVHVKFALDGVCDQRHKLQDYGALSCYPRWIASVADFGELGPEPSRAIILNSKPIQVQISMFNKLQQKLDDQKIRGILSLLPEPFSDIKTGWGILRIESTDVSLKFVAWLKARRIISLWSRGGFLTTIFASICSENEPRTEGGHCGLIANCRHRPTNQQLR